MNEELQTNTIKPVFIGNGTVKYGGSLYHIKEIRPMTVSQVFESQIEIVHTHDPLGYCMVCVDMIIGGSRQFNVKSYKTFQLPEEDAEKYGIKERVVQLIDVEFE